MSDVETGPELQACPRCGAIGLPERIANHDCESFSERQVRRQRR
jgi:ribosomal protein L32